eukprot:COSAG01_NODE_2213_length_8163_cov_18.627327_12_plen_40_part_00
MPRHSPMMGEPLLGGVDGMAMVVVATYRWALIANLGGGK